MNPRYSLTVSGCLILLMMIAAFAAPAARAQMTGAGRSFVLTVPYTIPPSNLARPNVRLLLKSGPATDVTLTYTATGSTVGFSMPANSSKEQLLETPQVFLPEQEGRFDLSLEITSTEPVAAMLLFDREFVSEAYAPLPDTMLGFEYYAVSAGASAFNGSAVTVIGVRDSTAVTITPSSATRGRLPGQPFTVTLDRGEVYQILSDPAVSGDLSGTHIVANKPCGVISGSYRADFPFGSFHKENPLLEQLPSVDSWGKEFMLAPLWRSENSLFKVVAACDGTTVTVGTANFTLNRGESFQQAGGIDPLTIRSNQPVMVAQMVLNTARGGQDADSAYGDPSMMILSPVSQWSDRHDFVLPSMAPRADNGGAVAWQYFAQVSLPKSIESALRIDNNPPAWIRRYDLGTYVIGITRLAATQHSITAPAPIATNIYGYSATDAFGFTPSSLARPYPLEAANLLRYTCGDSDDVLITIRNPGTLDYQLTYEFTGEIDGSVMSPAPGTTIVAGGSLDVRVHLKGLRAGRNRGYLVVRGGACGARLLAVELVVYSDQLEFAPPFGSTIDFGGVPLTVPSVDTTVYLFNAGPAPVTVNAPTITPSQFQLLSPSVWPQTLAPANALPVILRFRPDSSGPFTGTLAFTTTHCPEPQEVTLKGLRKRGAFIEGLFPAPLRMVCAPKTVDTLRFTLRNPGDSVLTISEGTIVGANAGEFTLLTRLTDPNGVQIVPAGTKEVLILYTPGPLGKRLASLRVISDAINRDTILFPFDVRNDSLQLDALIDSLDFGQTVTCNPAPILLLPVVNDGTIDLANLSAQLDLNRFRLTPSVPGLMSVGSRDTFRLELLPGVEGIIEDTLWIRSPLCDYALAVPIHGVRNRVLVAFERDTLDFGLLPRCVDSLDVTYRLSNLGTADETLQLDRLPTTPGISSILPDFPLTLPHGRDTTFRFRFHPGKAGDFVDSLKILALSCSEPLTLVLIGSRDTARPLFPSLLDFGPVFKGRVAKRSFLIVNHSRSPYSYDPLALVGGSPGVRLLRPDTPFVLGPGDTMEVELEYAPLDADEVIDDTLALHSGSPCDDSSLVTITGSSFEDERGIVLRWEDASAEVGAETVLRLTLHHLPEEGSNDSLLLRTTLRFNATMLLPIELRVASAGLTLSELGNGREGKERVIEMEIRGSFPPSGTIAELRALTLLGDADTTLLTVGQTETTRLLTNSSVPLFDSGSGVFRALGICRSGPVRLIESSGFFRLGASVPDPSSDFSTVEFETVEQGRTRLTMNDLAGERVTTLFDDLAVPGSYRVGIDAAEIPSGIYWLVLTTPTGRLTRMMTVLH
jgi:hypothetical protein